jgi:hypothetical protein
MKIISLFYCYLLYKNAHIGDFGISFLCYGHRMLSIYLVTLFFASENMVQSEEVWNDNYIGILLLFFVQECPHWLFGNEISYKMVAECSVFT